MRDLHARMLAALLGGEGLRGIAELAAEEAGGPVAIVLPARGLADASSSDVRSRSCRGSSAERLRGEAPGYRSRWSWSMRSSPASGRSGTCSRCARPATGLPALAVDRGEVLRTAALAALAEVAVAEARDEVADELRGSLLEDLRAGRVEASETARRAARLGCDLSRGAVAVVAEVRSSRPRHAAALISSEYEGAIAEPLGDRIYAILPGARRRRRARAHPGCGARPGGPPSPARAGRLSSFCASPGELGRAVARGGADAARWSPRDERMAEQLEQGIGNGVYRLLFRALASDPEEVRRFYDDTVEPLVAHDREYRTDLLGTLEAYLAHDCNMNATARAVYAHRHTVAHRLGRVKELTGLDPSLGEDRERLGLGIKAYRIIAPTLPR